MRGAVPIILGIFPLLAGLDNAQLYFNMAFFVVLISLLLQGSTVAPMARMLDLEVPPSGTVKRVDLELPGGLNYELAVYELTLDSPVLDRPSGQLSLPEGVRLAGIIRDKRVLTDCADVSLTAGDYVLLLTRTADLPQIDCQFVEPCAPARLEERRFFGEFVLNADATIGEVAALYGLSLPPGSSDQPLADFLADAFNGLPVVGDRMEIGHVEFVVREMDSDRIALVGLKLSHDRGDGRLR